MGEVYRPPPIQAFFCSFTCSFPRTFLYQFDCITTPSKPLVHLYHKPKELATRSPIGSLKARTYLLDFVYRIGTKPSLRRSYQLVMYSFYDISNPRNPSRHSSPIFQGESVIPVYPLQRYVRLLQVFELPNTTAFVHRVLTLSSSTHSNLFIGLSIPIKHTMSLVTYQSQTLYRPI